MKKRYYFIIAIVSYLFFTLGNIPAAKVVSLAEKNAALPVKLYGVHGSLWDGGASKLVAQGSPTIESLQWSLNPASLLWAHITGELRASIQKQNMIGKFSVGPTGSISGSDIRGRIEAAVMQNLIQMPLGELGGHFNIDIKSIEMQADNLPVTNANIKWKNAKLTIAETVDLGHVNLDIKSGDNQSLVATISSKNGQLEIDGTASVDGEKAYSVNIRITPDKNASSNITQSLAMFSRRQTDGSYLVKRKGNLKEFGI